MQIIKSLEIQIPAIHDIDTSSHNGDHIQDVHIVGATIAARIKALDLSLEQLLSQSDTQTKSDQGQNNE